MIDNGLPVVSFTISSHAVGASTNAIDGELLTIEPVVRPKSFFSFDGLGKLLFIASTVVLLLPAMLLVSVVAILVPCFLRVPLCGPAAPSSRMASRL